MNDFIVQPLRGDDGNVVVEIFNYYVENTFSAYPENKITNREYYAYLEMSEGYPTAKIVVNNTIAGFGMLRPFNKQEVFSHVAEASYFIHRSYTGKGMGTSLLEYLENEGRVQGITMLLVNISSKNPGSLHFHRKHGFNQCGLFQDVGKKNGHTFDMVWMQKAL